MSGRIVSQLAASAGESKDWTRDSSCLPLTVSTDKKHYAFLYSDLHADIEQFAKWGIELSVIEN